MSSSATPRGETAFKEYYRQFFATKHAFQAWLDQLSTKAPQVWLTKNSTLTASLTPVTWYPSAFYPGEPAQLDKTSYALNPSSLVPVLALEAGSGDLVLDACAAPGGKSLAIADQLGEYGHLVANDVSQARRRRLRTNLDSFGFTKSEVWGDYAEKISPQYPEHFDKILLDAPCSSEQHIYTTPKELEKWTPNRPQKLAKRQLNLLHQLWRALKPGGTLVYSTCAVTPEENEQVIINFVSDHQSAELQPISLPSSLDQLLTENLHHSPQMTHDVLSLTIRIHASDTFDPMFLAKIHKQK